MNQAIFNKVSRYLLGFLGLAFAVRLVFHTVPAVMTVTDAISTISGIYIAGIVVISYANDNGGDAK